MKQFFKYGLIFLSLIPAIYLLFFLSSLIWFDLSQEEVKELCDWGINENEVLIKVCQVRNPEFNLEVRLMNHKANRVGQAAIPYKVLKTYPNMSMVDTLYFLNKDKLFLKMSLSGTNSKVDTISVQSSTVSGLP